jgi:hypothetical protein
LWNWYVDHAGVALSNWPTEGLSDGQVVYRWGNDDRSLIYFQNNLMTMRMLSPEYVWIYDEDSTWIQVRL